VSAYLRGVLHQPLVPENVQSGGGAAAQASGCPGECRAMITGDQSISGGSHGLGSSPSEKPLAIPLARVTMSASTAHALAGEERPGPAEPALGSRQR